jgi:hypothetical protein
MSKKCLKCNSPVKLSPHNQHTGYESYRCSNPDCNSLFDVSDFESVPPELPKDRIITGGYGMGKSNMRKVLNRAYQQTHSSNNGVKVSSSIKQDKFDQLRKLFGDKLNDIAFDGIGVINRPRNVHNCPQYNFLSSGEKIVVDFLLHLYNPALMEWPLSNLNKLDSITKTKVLKVISNYNTYCF